MAGADRVSPLDDVICLRDATVVAISRGDVPLSLWTRRRWRRDQGVPEQRIGHNPVFSRRALEEWSTAYRVRRGKTRTATRRTA
jgi:hypothetical protein